MTKIHQYLIALRHGQTLPNLLLEQPTSSYYYEVTGSDTTIGLTARGHVQVNEAVQFIVRFLGRTRISKVFCSQFLRTRQSGGILQEALPNHPPLLEDERIAKRNYGEFWNITYEGVQALYPDEYQRYAELGGFLYRPPGGENYADLKKRIASFVRDEIDPTDENICISGHSAGILLLEQLLLGEMTNEELVERYDNMALLNASVTIYRRTRSEFRLFGLRLNPAGWFKKLLGLKDGTWVKVTSYTPSSAMNTASRTDADNSARGANSAPEDGRAA